jgi:hypothetical protein
LGSWDDYFDYRYSGYRDLKFPGYKKDPKEKVLPPKPAKNVGWDISHARRFVDVFNTLHYHRMVTGETFPDLDTMKGFANQFAYSVFQKDLNNPQFANFFDGTDGWYRVNYRSRPNFGYGPIGSSYDSLDSAVLTSGYGFWTEFVPDIAQIIRAAYKHISVSPTYKIAALSIQAPYTRQPVGCQLYSGICPPLPLTPTDHIKMASRYMFRWEPSKYTVAYQLWLQDAEGNKVFETEISACEQDVERQVCQASLSLPAIAPGRYHWHVRPVTAGGLFGPVSPGRWVVFLNSAPTKIPQPISPSGSVAEPFVSFSWQPIEGADGYEIQIEELGTETMLRKVFVEALAAQCQHAEQVCRYLHTGALSAKGKFSWQVRAKHIYGSGPWSTKKTFSRT